jgi:hypothetical protein
MSLQRFHGVGGLHGKQMFSTYHTRECVQSKKRTANDKTKLGQKGMTYEANEPLVHTSFMYTTTRVHVPTIHSQDRKKNTQKIPQPSLIIKEIDLK